MRIAPYFLFLAISFVNASAAESTATKPASDISRLDPSLGAKSVAGENLVWHDVATWGVEGREWRDMERLRWFDRFPAAAEKTVPPNVWKLSRSSAGMMVRFKTDATAVHVHYKLYERNLAMTIMPATGVSGVDLYARDAAGRWRWVAVARPTAQETRAELVKDLAPGNREYAAYLPLYNGVDVLEIGVPFGAHFEGLAPRLNPIVFYGTSITQGAAASRPGMAHTAILGRRLDVPVVNLGFSGNGCMDASVGALLTKIDAAAYVIDCVPNMDAALVRERCAPLVRQLRAARPETPVILVEDRRHTNDWIVPSLAKMHDENHAALRETFDALQKEGVKNLFYVPGDHLYGDDAEGATDASHASDLGFMRQADAMEPILRAALQH